MAAQVEAQRSDAGVGQARGQPGEEAALFPGDAPTMDEHHSPCGRLCGRREGTGEVQTVEGAYTHGVRGRASKRSCRRTPSLRVGLV